MIKEIIQLQDEVNTKTSGKHWRSKELLWTFAMTQETAELIESLNLKWWKGTNLDIKDHTYDEVIETTGMDFDNIVIESVDLLHFLISKYQIQFDNEEIEDMFNSYVTNYEPSILTKGSAEWKQDVFLCAREFIKELDIRSFIILNQAIGVSIETIYGLYLGKNTLNTFRQDHGYKEGTYKKMWKGKEDNEVMFMYVKAGWGGDALYKKLEKEYR